MKIKSDFITNSSSASFIVLKRNLTKLQIMAIHEHCEIAYLLFPGDVNNREQFNFINDPIGMRIDGFFDAWKITETETEIRGWTSMDNFDMLMYMTEFLKIPRGVIDYGREG